MGWGGLIGQLVQLLLAAPLLVASELPILGRVCNSVWGRPPFVISSTSSSHCGLPQDRYPTLFDGHWVLLEPRIVVPAHTVPPRRRWVLTADRVAMNLWDAEPLPGTKCRIAHRMTCPYLEPEAPPLWVIALRQENEHRAQRLALATAVEAGCTGTRILRADSQFYNAGVISACRRAGAHFSITCGMNPSIKRAIHTLPDQAWQQITYPTAVPDPATGELISDAEVAEIPAYTAFASHTKAERVTARLIVRRVRDLAKPAVVGEQCELFPVWRYHPFFTDQPAQILQAEREHRHHAVIEQVIADS